MDGYSVKYLRYDHVVDKSCVSKMSDLTCDFYVYTPGMKGKAPEIDEGSSCVCGCFRASFDGTELQCVGCGRWCHDDCVFGDKTTPEIVEAIQAVWKCPLCLGA